MKELEDLFLQLIGYGALILISFLVYRDAKSRDMDAGLWSIFVLLLLIIGLPAYFIYRKPKKAKELFIIEELRDKEIISEEEYLIKLQVIKELNPQIKQLEELKANGIITEIEFFEMRKKAINNNF